LFPDSSDYYITTDDLKYSSIRSYILHKFDKDTNNIFQKDLWLFLNMCDTRFYIDQGNYESALDTITHSLNFLHSNDNPKYLKSFAISYFLLGRIQFEMNQFEDALKSQKLSIEYSTKCYFDIQKDASFHEINKINILMNSNLKLNKNQLKLFDNYINQRDLVLSTLTQLIDNYDPNNYLFIQQYARESIKQFKEYGNYIDLSFCCLILAKVLCNNSNYDEAIHWIKYAINENLKNKSIAYFYNLNYDLAKIYMEKGDFTSALKYAEFAEDYIDKKNNRRLHYHYDLVSNIHLNLKDYHSTLFYINKSEQCLEKTDLIKPSLSLLIRKGLIMMAFNQIENAEKIFTYAQNISHERTVENNYQSVHGIIQYNLSIIKYHKNVFDESYRLVISAKSIFEKMGELNKVGQCEHLIKTYFSDKDIDIDYTKI